MPFILDLWFIIDWILKYPRRSLLILYIGIFTIKFIYYGYFEYCSLLYDSFLSLHNLYISARISLFSDLFASA